MGVKPIGMVSRSRRICDASANVYWRFVIIMILVKREAASAPRSLGRSPRARYLMRAVT